MRFTLPLVVARCSQPGPPVRLHERDNARVALDCVLRQQPLKDRSGQRSRTRRLAAGRVASRPQQYQRHDECDRMSPGAAVRTMLAHSRNRSTNHPSTSGTRAHRMSLISLHHQRRRADSPARVSCWSRSIEGDLRPSGDHTMSPPHSQQARFVCDATKRGSASAHGPPIYRLCGSRRPSVSGSRTLRPPIRPFDLGNESMEVGPIGVDAPERTHATVQVFRSREEDLIALGRELDDPESF
jgi:hypothetical protein